TKTSHGIETATRGFSGEYPPILISLIGDDSGAEGEAPSGGQEAPLWGARVISRATKGVRAPFPAPFNKRLPTGSKPRPGGFRGSIKISGS
ncbi:MAG: hypothetical protein PHP64_01840, partial [Actinomycetota bacterium]|nr:hypothetical protein [Actinomycetota bacterium]